MGIRVPVEEAHLATSKDTASFMTEGNRQVCTFGDGRIRMICSDGIYFVNEGKRHQLRAQRNERGRESLMVSKDELYSPGKKNIMDG